MLMLTAATMESRYIYIDDDTDKRKAANKMLKHLIAKHGYFKKSTLAFLEDYEYKDDRKNLIAVIVDDDDPDALEDGELDIEYYANYENTTLIFTEEYKLGTVKQIEGGRGEDE